MEKQLLRKRLKPFFTGILTLGLLLGISFAQATTITIQVGKKNIVEVLNEIQKQTNLKFVYNPDLLSNERFKNQEFVNEEVEKVLQALGYTTIEEGANIIVKKQVTNRSNLTQQENTVTGTVTDAEGEKLVGVSILLKGTNKGTSTDINGNFVIDVTNSRSAVLVFNYVGYHDLEVSVNGRKKLDVILKINDSALDEVVVVGFGQQKKISLIGAQSTVKVSDLQLPVRNINNSLAGRVAGVVSVQRNGEPGSDNADIWIRGISTFSNSQSKPLILVDGVPRSSNDVDPEDIESFSILKDASATAVYGVRGANGVIIVNTKQGTSGKPKFNLRYNEGITKFTKVPEFADGVTYMKMSNEALTNRGASPRYSDEAIQMTADGSDPYLYPNVDWYDELFNDFGNNRRLNLNINGGSDRAIYYVAASLYDEKGLYKTDALSNYDSQVRYKRYNLTSNLTVKPTLSTTVKLGVQGYLANVNYPGTGASSIFEKAFFMTPILTPVSYPGGLIADVATSSVQNPYALLTQTGYANQWRNQLFTNLRVTQELDFLTKGLSATAMFAFDAYSYVSLRRTKTPDTWLANGRDSNGDLILQPVRTGTEFLEYERVNQGSRTIYNEAAINYNRIFGNDHAVSGLLLYNQSDEINTLASNFENSLPYRFRGIAARATYSYKDKYLTEFNFGYNGSENFLPGNRYGFFPSIGLGWVISEENFFEGAKDVVQLAKIRFSHGTVGNSNIGGRRFAYLGTVAEKTGEYSFGKGSPKKYTGYDIGEYAVDVTWETATKTNLGFDFWTANNNLNVQVDFFKERREGAFLRRASLPAYVGMRNNPYGNVGKIDNQGIDGSLTYNGKIGQDFDFSLLANFTFNRNKIIEDDKPDPIYPWLATKGRKVGQRFGYIALGLFESEEDIANSARQTGDVRPGDIKFKDLNGDGVINAYDEAPIGYGQVPEIVYGFGFSLGYKAFSLSTLFQGVSNMDIWMNGEGLIPFQQGLSRGNLFNNIEDRWTVENPNPNAFYPRLGSGTINDNYSSSSWWIDNGRYLRLKSLELSYKLPKSFIERMKLKNANVFFSGVNLLTFSPFKLWDVELGDGKDDKYPGGAMYPNIATYSLGINLNF